MVHGQFEIIHPFIDGNGRLGRILIPLFLFERGLLSRPVFYLSAYIEEHQDEYLARLSALSSKQGLHAWNKWVQFFRLSAGIRGSAGLTDILKIRSSG
jgi:Fic family protein